MALRTVWIRPAARLCGDYWVLRNSFLIFGQDALVGIIDIYVQTCFAALSLQVVRMPYKFDRAASPNRHHP